jgi:ferredoxin-NADP reductase
MADHNDPRNITLIWSNQTPEHTVLPHVFEKLAVGLSGLRVVHVMTRAAEFEGELGRLDRPMLKRLLSDCSRTAAVFVCGPDQMMTAVRSFAVSLGFERRRIFMERFSL